MICEINPRLATKLYLLFYIKYKELDTVKYVTTILLGCGKGCRDFEKGQCLPVLFRDLVALYRRTRTLNLFQLLSEEIFIR